MGKYSPLLRKTAADELSAVPKKDLRRLIARIRKLAEDPRPQGCRKLSAQERYRLRQGDYRIIYRIDDSARTVEIFKIGHRSEIYR